MAKKYPDPTPPKETSAAQTGSSVSTAIANAFLQNPTEITPDGSTQVSPTGSWRWTDTYTGQVYDIPTFTRTTTLSPKGQEIKAAEDAAKLNLTRLARNQSGFLDGYLGTPVSLDNEATEARLAELAGRRLEPILAQRREAEATRLADQGIRLGSTAYDRAMSLVDQAENDARNELLLKGRAQAVQEALAERNQPINEITALLSGGQVGQPQFMGADLGPIPTTDNAGIIANYDDQRIQIAQMQNQLAGQILGGLFGLFPKLSDDEAKKDTKKVADLTDDVGLWAFRYRSPNDDGRRHLGLMASEVEEVAPQAVSRRPDGLRQVDYGRALGAILGLGG